jgi:hypothetical protein
VVAGAGSDFQRLCTNTLARAHVATDPGEPVCPTLRELVYCPALPPKLEAENKRAPDLEGSALSFTGAAASNMDGVPLCGFAQHLPALYHR